MMRPVWLALILALTGITAPAWGQSTQPDAPATVALLVRHAEKAALPADDPPLTQDGRRRAEALAGIVKDAHPTAIITTQLRRTVETGQPSAAAMGITPEVVPVSSATTQQNAADVATAVRKHAGKTVLVVGHGNTVPEIIAALGGPHLPDICEPVYDKLFVLVLGIAAFGGALVAWLGSGFPVQATTASVIAAIGTYGVHLYRVKHAQQQMKPLDAGQPATFEDWVNRDAQLARVRYRGAVWEARVEGDAEVAPGAMLYVLAAQGNTLSVSKTRPA